MVHNGPVGEALVAQVAQVVAVAPHLLAQLRVADRRAGHVLVHRVRVLRQARREIAQVVVHLRSRARTGNRQAPRLPKQARKFTGPAVHHKQFEAYGHSSDVWGYHYRDKKCTADIHAPQRDLADSRVALSSEAFRPLPKS